MKKTFRVVLASALLTFAAACGGDAGTEGGEGADAEGGSILPPAGAEVGDSTGVGDFGTGTGDAQSGGELTGEVPDSAAGGTTP